MKCRTSLWTSDACARCTAAKVGPAPVGGMEHIWDEALGRVRKSRSSVKNAPRPGAGPSPAIAALKGSAERDPGPCDPADVSQMGGGACDEPTRRTGEQDGAQMACWSQAVLSVASGLRAERDGEQVQ